MTSSPPTTVPLSDIFLRDSGTTQDASSHFCFAYHYPCRPHASGPVSKDSRENSEHSLMLEIQPGVNRQPVGKATSPDDSWNAGPLDTALPQMDDDEVLPNGHLSREGGDRDHFFMLHNPPLGSTIVDSNRQEFWPALSQSQIAPATPIINPAEEFDIDEFVKGFGVSPGSLPKLSDEDGSDQALEATPSFELNAYPAPLEPTFPEPHLPEAYSIVPLPPHTATQSLSPTPTASQSQSSPLQTDSANTAVHSKPAEIIRSLAPLVADSAMCFGLGAQHVTAPFFQPQPLLSHPPVSSPAHSQQLLPVRSNLAQLWSIPRSADGRLGGSSVSLQLPPSLVAYHPASTMSSQQGCATRRPQVIHAPTPRRILGPPLLTASNIRMTPAVRPPVNAMCQQAVPNSYSYLPIPRGFSTQNPSANSVSHTPGVFSGNLPAVPVGAPDVSSPPQVLRRELHPLTNVDSNNNDNARRKMLQQARLYASQVSSTSNRRAYKRSFEQLEMSNPISILVTNPKPPKRQHLQHALKPPTAQPQPQLTLPLSFSSQLIPSSFINNQSTPFTEPHSEAGPSAQMSNISNTLGARVSSSGRLRPRKKTKGLAAYKEFLGNIYICAWGTCSTTLSFGAYQDLTAFQNDVFNHLEGHLPRELESDGKWHCQWSMKSSVSCAEELHDLRGIIRHIYGRHQESKGKCKNCPQVFSRKDQFNIHQAKCNGA